MPLIKNPPIEPSQQKKQPSQLYNINTSEYIMEVETQDETQDETQREADGNTYIKDPHQQTVLIACISYALGAVTLFIVILLR